MRGASELGAKFRCHRCGAKKSMWKSTAKFNPFADPCQQQLVFYLTHSKALTTRCYYFSQGVKKKIHRKLLIFEQNIYKIYTTTFFTKSKHLETIKQKKFSRSCIFKKESGKLLHWKYNFPMNLFVDCQSASWLVCLFVIIF